MKNRQTTGDALDALDPRIRALKDLQNEQWAEFRKTGSGRALEVSSALGDAIGVLAGRQIVEAIRKSAETCPTCGGLISEIRIETGMGAQVKRVCRKCQPAAAAGYELLAARPKPNVGPQPGQMIPFTGQPPRVQSVIEPPPPVVKPGLSRGLLRTAAILLAGAAVGAILFFGGLR